MSRSRAYAKINLALVVGPLRRDAKHEVVTVLQRIDLYDDVEVELADGLAVEGFPQDTIVRESLEALARAADVPPSWHARIEKRIPVGAGLGGGSADGAAALELANVLLSEPLTHTELHEVAASFCVRALSSRRATAPSSRRSSSRGTTSRCSSSRTGRRRSRPKPSTGDSTRERGRRDSRSGARPSSMPSRA
jgi:hypothetical protein